MSNDEFYCNFCEKLKEEMNKRFIKHYEMAEILNMKKSTFSSKINGHRKNGSFTLYEIKRIADELLMTIDELIS